LLTITAFILKMKIILKKVAIKYKESFITAYNEFPKSKELEDWVYLGPKAAIDYPLTNFAEYTQSLLSREQLAPEDFVRDSVYWAINNQEEVFGRISIRHELNDFLRKAGGHIGYIVRPSARRKGVATEMLRQVLHTEKAKELKKMLITCDIDNIASKKIIEKNGGELIDKVFIAKGRPYKFRYWIFAK